MGMTAQIFKIFLVDNECLWSEAMRRSSSFSERGGRRGDESPHSKQRAMSVMGGGRVGVRACRPPGAAIGSHGAATARHRHTARLANLVGEWQVAPPHAPRAALFSRPGS